MLPIKEKLPYLYVFEDCLEADCPAHVGLTSDPADSQQSSSHPVCVHCSSTTRACGLCCSNHSQLKFFGVVYIPFLSWSWCDSILVTCFRPWKTWKKWLNQQLWSEVCECLHHTIVTWAWGILKGALWSFPFNEVIFSF